MPNIMVLDTETINLNKPFVYDIGFIIVNENFEVLEKKHYIIKQVYENRELFETAYYKIKKPKYAKLLRSKKAEKMYYGVATQKLKQLMSKYGVGEIYAYNSSFDQRALKFTTDFYKVKDVFAEKTFVDIKQLAKPIHEHIDYLLFTKDNDKLTATGRASRTAETTYQFLIKDPAFIEDHIGLSDCEIELEILRKVV